MSRVGTTSISADAGGRKGEEGKATLGVYFYTFVERGIPGMELEPISTFLAVV